MRKEDIKQVLTALGSTKFTDSGESVQTNCPLAKWEHDSGKDSRPSLGVKEDTGMSFFHCFTCNNSGGLMTLVRTYASYAIPEGIITQERVKELVDFIFLAEDEEVEVSPQIVEIPKPPDNILTALGTWHDYFQSRGISKETFELWNLGFHDSTSRAMFPVYDNKEVVGLVGRTTLDDAVKWKNYPPKFKKSAYLYGLHLKKKQPSVIVVEGPIDTIKVNDWVDDDYWCVGLLGAEPSKTQMDLLIDNAEEVIIMLDNDSSGKRGQKALIEGIGKRTILSLVEYPEEVNDPGALAEEGEDKAKEMIMSMLNNRISSLEWQLHSLIRRSESKCLRKSL